MIKERGPLHFIISFNDEEEEDMKDTKKLMNAPEKNEKVGGANNLIHPILEQYNILRKGDKSSKKYYYIKFDYYRYTNGVKGP